VTARIAALAPAVPDVSQLVAVDQADWSTAVSISVNGYSLTLGFDGVTGAFSTLNMAGVDWADAQHLIGQYYYRTYNDTDYAANPTCCYGEGGRQKATNAQQTLSMGTMTGLWVDDETNTRRAVVSLSMPDLQHEQYGAPSAVWLSFDVNDDASISATVQIFNVTATRLGGAHFYHVGPIPQPGDYSWLMDKIGSWVSPLDTVTNGGVHQHGVSDEGVRYVSASAPGKFLSVQTLDAPLVDPFTAANPASMFPLPLAPLTGPVLGFDVQLMQNAFNTNTPLFSWDPAFRWRFRISASQ
jgi:hypothetical protein